MSVSGIATSLYNTQSVQSMFQQFQQTFQQLGKDLQSGNLSAAQSDFATLQQLQPQTKSASSSQSNNPIAQAFSQLSTDLQSGNLSAAQNDYTTIQQAMQSQSTKSEATHGHHHHGGGGSGTTEISQLLDQLGSALQSGDLSTAQSTFATLQQTFQQSAPSNGQTSAQSGSNNFSVTA
jgi:outer membrane protein assembly factor BamD (BamD/ComL family)